MKKIIIWTTVIMVVIALSAGLAYSLYQINILRDDLAYETLKSRGIDEKLDLVVYEFGNAIVELHEAAIDYLEKTTMDDEDWDYKLGRQQWKLSITEEILGN